MDPELLRQTSGFDYLFAFGWAALLAASLFLWPIPRRERNVLFVAWGAKVAVTLGVMLAYEAYYPFLDSYAYFTNGQLGLFDWDEVKFGRGTELVTAFSSLHSVVLPTSYHSQKVTCAYVGLIAIYQFYVAARRVWPGLNVTALYVLAYFPSILFWGSILGKDPFVLLGIALFVRGIVAWYRGLSTAALGYAVLGAAIAASIRPWMAALLIAPLVVFILVRVRRVWARAAFLTILVVGGTFAYVQFTEAFRIADATDLVDASNAASRQWSIGGSAQDIGAEFNGVGDLLAFAPLGVFTALLRPLPGELLTPFGLVASLENGLLLLLLLRAVVRFRFRDFRDPLILWSSAFILIWSLVYGLVSYQNLGTAVRFRLQILPVFLGLLLFIGRKDDEGWLVAKDPSPSNASPSSPLARARVRPIGPSKIHRPAAG